MKSMYIVSIEGMDWYSFFVNAESEYQSINKVYDHVVSADETAFTVPYKREEQLQKIITKSNYIAGFVTMQDIENISSGCYHSEVLEEDILYVEGYTFDMHMRNPSLIDDSLLD